MIDLIYDTIEAQKVILKKFPEARFQDASDDIHPDRFEVDIEIENEDKWWEFCVKAGLGVVSLGFQLRLRNEHNKDKHKEFIDKVTKWVEEMDKIPEFVKNKQK